jgi:hypothetical protein
MFWFYLTLALAAASGGFLVGRAIKQKSGKHLIGAWLCLLAGVCSYLIWLLEGEHSPLLLALAPTCLFVCAAVLLFYSRRITRGQS